MSNTRKAKKPSLAEAARNAKPRVEHYDIPQVDSDTATELAETLGRAKAKVKSEEMFGTDPAVLAAAKKTLAAAQRAYDAGFRRVSFKGLPPKVVDALQNEHPTPAEGEPEPDDYVEFVYHLAEASALTDDDRLDAATWKDLCDNRWPGPEVIAFRNAVLGANSRQFTEGIPKG